MCGSGLSVNTRKRDSNGRFASTDSKVTKEKNMITVNNEYIEDVDTTLVRDLDSGSTFIGTVEDTAGDVRTGLFLKFENVLVYFDDTDAEFEDANANFDLKVLNYKTADITVTVDYAY